MRDVFINYKRHLYRDWLSGRFTKEQLAEKYQRSIFKINLIIEKMERQRRNG